MLPYGLRADLQIPKAGLPNAAGQGGAGVRSDC